MRMEEIHFLKSQRDKALSEMAQNPTEYNRGVLETLIFLVGESEVTE